MDGAGLKKFPLTFAGLTALEWFDHAGGNTQRAVRHDPLVVEPNHPAKTTAIGAGSQGIIKAKESGGGGADVDVAMGTVPSRRMGESFVAFRIDQSDPFFAKSKGGLNRLGESSSFGRIDLKSILDHLDDGWKLSHGDRFIGAMHRAIDPDA